MSSSFTVKQQKCIELLALGEMTQAAIAEQIKICPPTISKWKQSQSFMEAVIDRSRELLRESLPAVYNRLAKNSKLGSERHVKIFLDHLEKLEAIKSSKGSISITWNPPTPTKETEDV